MSILKSRKARLAFIALAVVIVNEATGLDLDPVALGAIILPILAAIIGTAWEDAAEKGATVIQGDGPPTAPE